MSLPRFLFSAVSTMPASASDGREVPRASRPRAAGPLLTYSWRLVAGNNHLLGRGPVGLPTVEACRDAVAALLAWVDEAVITPAADSRPGQWRWQLVRHVGDGDRDVLAVSARHYPRQRESRYNAEQFRAAVPRALVSDVVTVRAPSRVIGRIELGPGPTVPLQRGRSQVVTS